MLFFEINSRKLTEKNWKNSIYRDIEQNITYNDHKKIHYKRVFLIFFRKFLKYITKLLGPDPEIYIFLDFFHIIFIIFQKFRIPSEEETRTVKRVFLYIRLAKWLRGTFHFSRLIREN